MLMPHPLMILLNGKKHLTYKIELGDKMPTFTWNDHQIFYRKQGKGSLLLILPGSRASSICHQEKSKLI